MNRKVDIELVKLEKEYQAEQNRIAREKAEKKRIAKIKAKQEQIAREKAEKERKIAAERLALAKNKGFNSYKEYQQDLAQKAEAKRLAEIEAIKKAEDSVSQNIKDKFKYLSSKRFCKSADDLTCKALNTAYKEYSNRNVSTGWLYCKQLRLYETQDNNRDIMMANKDIIKVCKRQMDQYMQYNLRQYGKGGIGNQDIIDMNWITNRARGRF